jgi:flagella basal body P-ring formation protein FlgA
MNGQGIFIARAQVKMLSTIPAKKEHPFLEALKIEMLSSDSSRVLLRCVDRSACIPFYVVVKGLDPGQRLAADAQKTNAITQKSAPGELVIRKGSTVVLQIVAPKMLITVPVVCLQSGRQGDRIKVSLIDHSRTYLAEIVSPKLLRSRL